MATDEESSAGTPQPSLDTAGEHSAQASGRLYKYLGTWPRRAGTFVAVTVAGAVIAQFVPDVRHSVFGANRGFHGTILRPPEGPPDVTIRDRPTNSSLNAGTLSPGTGVLIICTAHGDPVAGPSHGGGTLTSRLWDKVRADSSNNPLGFVPDALVNTGTTEAEASGC